VEEIQKAAHRSAELTRQLLAFARKQTIAPRLLDLNHTIEPMLKMLQRLIGEDIDLRWRPGDELEQVLMDPGQLDQILVNLCVNARDAIGTDVGKITIETGAVRLDEEYCADHPGFSPGRFVVLSVSDDGCGMDEETRSHIFEPFFTSKPMGKGTGLGLATVYGIVKQNDGFVNVYSEPGQGTTFRIFLPVPGVDGSSAPAAVPYTDETVRGQETVLLVEDEKAMLELSTRMLKRLGYGVVAASTPGEAIRMAREHEGDIHLLMTDVVMPEMNGRDLAVHLLNLFPDIQRLFISGYTADVIAHHGVLEDGVHFLQKPFTMADLASKLREALDEGDLPG
jgi:CheY-like chemotaxis protein